MEGKLTKNFTKVELQNICKNCGISTDGLKNDIVQRITEYLKQSEPEKVAVDVLQTVQPTPPMRKKRIKRTIISTMWNFFVQKSPFSTEIDDQNQSNSSDEQFHASTSRSGWIETISSSLGIIGFIISMFLLFMLLSQPNARTIEVGVSGFELHWPWST